jgi:outer membrane cobalamin receptor
MNTTDKNFHINFSPFYAIVAVMMLMFVANKLQAQEIEEIVVIGATIYETESDPSTDVNVLESIIPEATTSGGYGSFLGYTERGTQTIHTTIFRNGVPANDAGSGWYDFGHDFSTGNEKVKIVNGPNSVLYGSGSLGGSIFITDDLKDGSILRLGSNTLLSHTGSGLNITYFDAKNDSVRTDNDEQDSYNNLSVKGQKEFGDWKVNVTGTTYEYDYDNCYTASFSQSNDCVQNGDKGSLSARNDNYTFGYTFNNANYKTESVETYKSDAERFYADTRHTVGSNIYGATVEYEKYEDMSQDSISAYALLNYEPINIGLRLSEDAFVYRLGAESNDWFGSVGTSYRNPTLYELNGDAWTAPNPNLDPEEAFGGEVGYKNFTVFKYKFSEGINYSFADSQFVNTGSYDTEGVRYTNSFVVERLNTTNIGVELGYTNSDQPRVPEYKAIISSTTELEGFDITFRYTGLFNREPGAYDGTEMLDDVSSLDYKVEKSFPNYLLSFTIRDILDDEFEMVPNYRAGGLEYFLTLQYRP